MGKATKREYRFSHIVRANTRICGKKNNDGQSLPLEGKVASEASRIGFWRDEKERRRSSQVRRLREYPSAARGPLSQIGKAKRRGLRRPKRKPIPPRCARQPLPREGARVDTPSFHRKEVPRRGGGWMGGSGMKKIGGDRLKCAIYESAATPDTKPSPRGEGGERSEPDRVLVA